LRPNIRLGPVMVKLHGGVREVRRAGPPLSAIALHTQAFCSLDAKLARIADATAHGIDNAPGDDFLDEIRLASVVKRTRRPLENVAHETSDFGSKGRFLKQPYDGHCYSSAGAILIRAAARGQTRRPWRENRGLLGRSRSYVWNRT
jgi:hypothetical protein